MQIILEHWTDVRLKSPAKKVNASVIKEFTGVDNYKGRADQRKEIMKHITVENYQDMYTRICKMQNDDTVIVKIKDKNQHKVFQISIAVLIGILGGIPTGIIVKNKIINKEKNKVKTLKNSRD